MRASCANLLVAAVAAARSAAAAVAAHSAAAKPPHLVVVLADDLGWYDTSVHNPGAPTPSLKALADEGLILERHYVFRYCSPTRRSLLTGRFPTSISSVQPDGDKLCSDFLPLAATTLGEKLQTAGYVSHFIGKGHLGYATTDHLPIHRGFASHFGFLAGSETYAHGGGDANASAGAHDLWRDAGPARSDVPRMTYSTDAYAARFVEIASSHDPSSRLFVYFSVQNVHAPYQDPPEDDRGGPWPDFKLCPNCTYAQMLWRLDAAVANATDALRRHGLWDETLLLFTADNGGIGPYANSHPLRGHKHDPWEGGTRATAFLAGGFLPDALRGQSTGAKLVHVADWYPTFCALAGTDPTDDAVFDGIIRPIDGVDVWPMLTGARPRALRKHADGRTFRRSASSRHHDPVVKRSVSSRRGAAAIHQRTIPVPVVVAEPPRPRLPQAPTRRSRGP